MSATARDISFSFSDLSNNVTPTVEQGLVSVENQILLQLAQQKVSQDVSCTVNGGQVRAGVAIPTMDQVEIHNGVLSPPNFVLMTNAVDVSMNPAVSNISNTLVVASDNVITGNSQARVFTTDKLEFNVSLPADPTLNRDASGLWQVSFDVSNNDRDVIRAINSHLNARNGVNAAYPMFVEELSNINSESLGQQGFNNVGYNYPYLRDVGLQRTDISNNNTNNVLQSGSGGTLYSTTYSAAANAGLTPFQSGVTVTADTLLYPNEVGTFRITMLDPSNSSDVFSSVVFPAGSGESTIVSEDMNRLPFRYLVNKNTDLSYNSNFVNGFLPDPAADTADVNMPNPVNYNTFGSMFPAINVANDFTFNISAVPGPSAVPAITPGGYYIANPGVTGFESYRAITPPYASVPTAFTGVKNVASPGFTDVSSVLTIDSTQLVNNYAYMRNNFQNNTHRLDISNGSLSVQSANNGWAATTALLNSGLSRGPESLPPNLAETNGSVILKIPSITNRVVNVVNSTNDLSNISVYYDGTDVSLNPLSFPNPQAIGVLSDINKTSSTVDMSAVLQVGGIRSQGSRYLYAGNVGGNIVSDASASLFLRRNETVSNFTSSGLDASAVYVSVTAIQNLAGDGFYGLDVVQDNHLFNSSDNTAIIGYETAPFLSPSLTASNVSFRDLSYIEYRVLFNPKSIVDLCGNDGLRFNDISLNLSVGKLNVSTNQKEITSYTAYAATTNLTQSLDNTKYLNQIVSNMDGNIIERGLRTSDLKNGFTLNTQITYNIDLVRDSDNFPKLIFTESTDVIKSDSPLKSFDIALESANGQFVGQLPLGPYENLMVTISIRSFNALIGQTKTLSFKVSALFGFASLLQGTNNPNNTFISPNDWINVTKNNGKSYVDVEAFTGYVSICDILGSTGSGSSVSISLPTNDINVLSEKLEGNFDFYLNNPSYTMRFVNDFTNTSSYVVSAASYTAADLSNNVANFASFSPSKYSAAPAGGSPLSLTVTSSRSNDIRRVTLTGANGLSFTFTIADSITTDFSIWYNTKDVYVVNTSLSGAPLTSTAIVNACSNNTFGTIAPGIVVQSSTAAPGSSVRFRLSNAIVRVLMAGSSVGNDIPYETEQPISTNVAGSTTYTRTLTFPLYRGYHSNNGLVTDTQNYTIARVPATVRFSIFDNSGVSISQQADLGILSRRSVEVSNLQNVLGNRGLPYNLGSLGLIINFQQSMLRDVSSNFMFPVVVYGDVVTIATSDISGGVATTNVYGTDGTVNLKAPFGVLFTFPGSGPSPPSQYFDASNAVIASRVTAGGRNTNGAPAFGNTTQIYSLVKYEASVQIDYSKQFLGNVASFNFADTTILVKTSILRNSGAKLNPNLTLRLGTATDTRTVDNCPVTYLVASSPQVKFTCNNSMTNLPGSIPFDVANYTAGTNVRYALLVDETAKTYPVIHPFKNFEGNLETNLVNGKYDITFTLVNGFPERLSTWLPTNIPKRNLRVAGNNLRLVEKTEAMRIPALSTTASLKIWSARPLLFSLKNRATLPRKRTRLAITKISPVSCCKASISIPFPPVLKRPFTTWVPGR